MNIQDIQDLINEHLELITVDARGLADAKNRAARLLVIQSILATFLKDFEEEKSKVKTMELATYAISIRASEGKNITEKKINVEENSEYYTCREALEKMEAIRDYIKIHIKIFDNAHLMFRQYSRE